MHATSALLVAIELIAASIWVGGMVCVAVVAKVARDVLDGPSQMEFFQSMGRRYSVVGTTSLFVAIAAGLALSWSSLSSRMIDATVALAGVLVVTTIIGMRQARAMTSLRRILITNQSDGSMANSLRRGRRLANALRGLMALITLAIVILGAWNVTR